VFQNFATLDLLSQGRREMVVTTINAWNRLAITMRTEAGDYQPKARPVSQTA
jgi:hypothetical protein